MERPRKPARTITRAKKLRRIMTLPEVLLWTRLHDVPGIRFRKQHAAGDYVLDFFCARANLAIEVDGTVHDMGDRPAHDATRDAWLRDMRIDTLRIPAREVLADPAQAAGAIVAVVRERLERFGKAPASGVKAPATSPSHVDGDTPPSGARAPATSPSQVDGEGLR